MPADSTRQFTAGLNSVANGSGGIDEAIKQKNRAFNCKDLAVLVVGRKLPLVLGDVITCVITNTRRARNATLVVTKTSTVLSDGISTANPKALPGSIVRYTITVQNTGNDSVDADSIILHDPFPGNIALDASTPITFTNGTVPSGLNAYNQSTMVTYSNTGSAPYSVPLGSGYNAAIRGFRFAPTGTMDEATAAGPSSFSITFVGRLN